MIHFENKKTSAYTNTHIYCSRNSVASYMFRLPIVAIIREVVFEVYTYITWNVKTNIKC